MLRTLFTAAIALLFNYAHATELAEDGLHKQDWFAITFKDVVEDLEEAAGENKHLVLLFEQRGCVYCRKLHEDILSDPEISSLMQEKFTVVQFNLFGDESVTDLDGESLSEKEAASKWGVMFTPTMIFLPAELDSDADGHVGNLAVGKMPGVMSRGMVYDLLEWVSDAGYTGEEHFQKYHARVLAERKAKAE